MWTHMTYGRGLITVSFFENVIVLDFCFQRWLWFVLSYDILVYISWDAIFVYSVSIQLFAMYMPFNTIWPYNLYMISLLYLKYSWYHYLSEITYLFVVVESWTNPMIVLSYRVYFKKYTHTLRYVVVCCGLAPINVTRILQGKFTGTRTILRLSQSKWRNSKWCE